MKRALRRRFDFSGTVCRSAAQTARACSERRGHRRILISAFGGGQGLVRTHVQTLRDRRSFSGNRSGLALDDGMARPVDEHEIYIVHVLACPELALFLMWPLADNRDAVEGSAVIQIWEVEVGLAIAAVPGADQTP